MESLDHLKPGDILRQADLATYVGAMALGVAEAQRALDDNSVNLLGEFVKAQPGLAGQSLIQLGLMPAFYHFRSATLSCSVSMSLQVRQEIEVGFELGAGSTTTTTKKVTKGSKAVKNFSDAIVISQASHLTASQNASSMQAIHSYSEQNSATGEYFALAERATVADAASYAATANSLAQYSSVAALFVVPPAAGLQWAVAKISAGPLTSGTNVKGFILSADATSQLSEVRFDNDSYKIAVVGGIDYAERLRALAAIIKALNPTGIAITGHTDGLGPADYNLRLSKLRAEAVWDVLLANQVPAAAIGTPSGTGESGATDNVAAPEHRNVTIEFAVSSSYIYLEETAANALTAYLTAQAVLSSDIIAQGSYLAVADVQKSQTTISTATTAVQLATEINNAAASTVEASQLGELVYLTNKASGSVNVAEVTVYAKDESGFAQDATTNFDQKTESSASTTTTQTTEKTVNRASAVAFSLDARYSRMFDLTMSGNMSLAAELVSIPAPPEFLKFVKDYLE